MDFSEIMGFLVSGNFLAALGCVFAIALAGRGSSVGLRLSGSAASGATAEKEKSFGSFLLLESLPQTQIIYAFIIAILIVSSMLSGDFSVEKGLLSLAAGMVVGLSGLSAIEQGKTAAAAIGAVAKNQNITGKVMIYVVMVEITALLGFIIALLLLIAGKVF